MTTFYNRSGQTFDQLFEPDSAGPTITGFYNSSGSLIRYAPRSAGSKIANVEFYNSSGSDVTNHWAGRGTVSYTVPSMPDIGTLSPMFHTPAVSVSAGRRTLCRSVLTIKRNGTWNWTWYSRNFVALVVRGHGSRATDYHLHPDGLLHQQGNWAQTPVSNFGDNYTMDVVQELLEYGRRWITVEGGAEQWQMGGNYGAFNNQSASWIGLGTNISLNQDREIDLHADMTNLEDVGRYRDPPGGLRRFSRGTVLIRIKRNGNTVLQFRFRACTINEYGNINIIVPEGGSGGGSVGGGGGGGGVRGDVFGSGNIVLP